MNIRTWEQAMDAEENEGRESYPPIEPIVLALIVVIAAIVLILS